MVKIILNKIPQKACLVWHVGRIHMKIPFDRATDMVSIRGVIDELNLKNTQHKDSQAAMIAYLINTMRESDKNWKHEWEVETWTAFSAKQCWFMIGPEGMDILHGVDLKKNSYERYKDMIRYQQK